LTVGAGLFFGIVAAAVCLGCSHRSKWTQDESHRIDEAMKAEKFSPKVPGAAGTALEAAVPVAPPPSQVGYSLLPLTDKKPRPSKRGTKGKSNSTKGQPSPSGATLPLGRDGS